MLPLWPRRPSKTCSQLGPDWDTTAARATCRRPRSTIVELRRFPRDYAALRALPGIGDYTAAAVASIAFGKPHAVLDGNVLRVLSRLLAERGDIKSDAVRKKLRTLAEILLDPKRPGEFNQALMELGATVCVPKQPMCGACPVRPHCHARQQGIENQLPLNGVRPGASRQEKHLLVIEKGNKILLWQRPPDSRRLAGFWELPELAEVPGARFRKRLVNFATPSSKPFIWSESIELRSDPAPSGFVGW